MGKLQTAKIMGKAVANTVMMQEEKRVAMTPAQEIRKLHQEIKELLQDSLEKAFRIGEILAEYKRDLKHGEFIGWVNENLPFGDRQARNYMRLYLNRDELREAAKRQLVSDLKSGIQYLAEPLEKEIMRARYEEAKKEKGEEQEKSTVVLSLEQEHYLSVLREVLLKLPAEPPKDWTEEGMAQAKGLVEVIFRRLEAFDR